MASQVPQPGGLSKTQALYAAVIVSVGKSMHQSATQIQEALMAALTESGLNNYANANNTQSLAIPHDKVGSDHGSVGLFQQQVGGERNSNANWGTTAELMNPLVASQKFYQALDAKGQHGDAASTVQGVQGSVYSDGSNYRANQAQAAAIYAADANVSPNPGDVILGAVMPGPNAVTAAGTDVKNAVMSPVNAVKDGLKGIDAIASLGEQAASALVSEAFWLRVGFGFVGFMLLIIGIDMLARGGTVSPVTQQAVPPAPPATEPEAEPEGEEGPPAPRRQRAIGGRRRGNGKRDGLVKSTTEEATEVAA